MNLIYYNCYRHYPGEDRKGKYIFEVFLDGELVDDVLDANMTEGWIRKKIFDEYGVVSPSSKISGSIKIIKNYNY